MRSKMERTRRLSKCPFTLVLRSQGCMFQGTQTLAGTGINLECMKKAGSQRQPTCTSSPDPSMLTDRLFADSRYHTAKPAQIGT
ncbi:hypothetical protein EVAR_83566_1 [Eumeta japonica]|uniref:Uncharacterized protein n=1 Tax=Eumeta variegata TaxID=151549 RepID=A0A4C1UPF2_EUMVA|nr:hypothetical protein EVAR_83566_1 [Eumeta japonica]